MVSSEKETHDGFVNLHNLSVNMIKKYDAGEIQLTNRTINHIIELEKTLKQNVIDTKPNNKSMSKRLDDLEKIVKSIKNNT